MKDYSALLALLDSSAAYTVKAENWWRFVGWVFQVFLGGRWDRA